MIEGKRLNNIGTFKIGGSEYSVFIAKTKE